MPLSFLPSLSFVFFNDRENSFGSPLLWSTALFVGGNLLFYYIQQEYNNLQVWNDDDDSEDQEYEDGVDKYLRKRIERRLSFQNYQHIPDSSSSHRPLQRDVIAKNERAPKKGVDPARTVDFFPKNSNWTHFETHEESSTVVAVQRKSATPAQDGPVEEKGSAVWISLEGERVATNHSLGRRSSRSQDEPNGTDEEDSQASRDHFVWTDAEYRASKQFQKQKQKQGLPVILSERNVQSALLSNSNETSQDSGAASPIFLSQPSSLQGSVSDTEEFGEMADDDGEGDESDTKDKMFQRALSTASSLHFAPTKSESPISKEEPQAAKLSDSIPRPPSPANDFKTVAPSNNKKMPPRTTSAPLIRQTTPLSRLFQRSTSIQSTSSGKPLSHHRANYNARIMPKNLILIRHGQSMGNIDEAMYSTTPDNAIPLTKLGWHQARAAGKRLREIVKDSSDIHFIVSPYVRTVETFHGVASAWSDPENDFGELSDPLARRKAWYGELVAQGLSWAEDPRIREQDFGNLQDPAKIKQCKQERNRFGAFYYRFAHGESAADVFDRISTFLDSLWRSFDIHPSRHFVLVTHGIAIRVLLARYFRYTIDQFHLLSNPRNCEMIVLTHDGHGRLQMAGRHELNVVCDPPRNLPPANGEGPLIRYKFHRKLRVLPQEFVHKVKIRICYDETNTEDNK